MLKYFLKSSVFKLLYRTLKNCFFLWEIIISHILNFLLLFFLRKILFWTWWYWRFFSFSSSKRFLYLFGLFFSFFLFLFQKDSDIFTVLLFEAFLCFSQFLSTSFKYVYKRNCKDFLIVTNRFYIYIKTFFYKLQNIIYAYHKDHLNFCLWIISNTIFFVSTNFRKILVNV